MRRAIAAQASASRRSKACAPNVRDVRDLGPLPEVRCQGAMPWRARSAAAST
jgi:hypothetical protein